MIHIVQVKLVVNVCEEVPHPQAPVMMPGPPTEQYDITYTAKGRSLMEATKECAQKMLQYSAQIEGARAITQ